jgi:hypothetical protein
MSDGEAWKPLGIVPDSVRSECSESRIHISNLRSITIHIKKKGTPDWESLVIRLGFVLVLENLCQ